VKLKQRLAEVVCKVFSFVHGFQILDCLINSVHIERVRTRGSLYIVWCCRYGACVTWVFGQCTLSARARRTSKARIQLPTSTRRNSINMEPTDKAHAAVERQELGDELCYQ
jgi:hypothetical protein